MDAGSQERAIEPAKQSDASEGIPTVGLMSLHLAALDEEATIRFVCKALEHGRGGWICPVNLDVLRQVVECPDVRGLVESADLVVADGMPLVWAARVRGTPLPARV